MPASPTLLGAGAAQAPQRELATPLPRPVGGEKPYENLSAKTAAAKGVRHRAGLTAHAAPAAVGAWKTSQGLCIHQRLPAIPRRPVSPPPLLGSPPTPPRTPVPGVDCNCSQVAPEQESPNYPCQAAAKGADVTAQLPGTAQPPPRRGLRSEPGSRGLFPALVRPPGAEGDAEPRSPPGELSAAGHRGDKQLRGLIKGLALDTGTGGIRSYAAWDETCARAGQPVPRGWVDTGDMLLASPARPRRQHRRGHSSAPGKPSLLTAEPVPLTCCVFPPPGEPGATGEVLGPREHPWVQPCSEITPGKGALRSSSSRSLLSAVKCEGLCPPCAPNKSSPGKSLTH